MTEGEIELQILHLHGKILTWYVFGIVVKEGEIEEIDQDWGLEEEREK